jgi:hypothetical protein
VEHQGGTEERFKHWEVFNRCICFTAEWGAGLPEDEEFYPISDSSWLVNDPKDFFSGEDMLEATSDNTYSV